MSPRKGRKMWVFGVYKVKNNHATIFLHSLLEEESQKREELERLRQEQDELLRQERQEREGLEGVREKQERLLREAQDRLQQLEVERQAANAELQVGGAGVWYGRSYRWAGRGGGVVWAELQVGGAGCGMGAGQGCAVWYMYNYSPPSLVERSRFAVILSGKFVLFIYDLY